MIKLIKNEFIKILHKKALYILMILIVGLVSLQVFSLKFAEGFLESEEKYYEAEIKDLEAGQITDKEELKWVLEDKTEYDLLVLAKEFEDGNNSWEIKYLEDLVRDDIVCMNESKYLNKDDAKYKKCKSSLDKKVSYVKNNSWRDILNSRKKEYEESLKEVKKIISTAKDEEKSDLEREKKTIEYQIEGINYYLKNDIVPNKSKKAELIDSYVENAIAYLNYNEDESSYRERTDLLDKRNAEQAMKVTKYRLDNKLYYTDNEFSLFEAVGYDMVSPIFLVVVIIIMFAGNIMAEEYNKGTIKQLLLRPYTRTKILLSKFITLFLISLFFLIFYLACDIVIYGLAFGFEEVFMPVVIYDFASKTVLEMNLFKYILINLLALAPFYLIIMIVPFLIGTISGNSVISFVVTFMIYFVGEIIASLANTTNVSLLKFLPMMNWNLTEYLFGGVSSFKYCNLKLALIIDILTIVVLFFLSFFIFKKKNITNQ